MASADLRDELLCSICLSIYTDPVTLRCGHNFCRVCIEQVLATQDESRIYTCPACRSKTRKRPALRRNIDLCNVTKRIRSTQPLHGEVTWIRCTYCFHSPVPAVKSCLMCEASLCDDHLRVHSKGPEHVLTDPSTSLENRKCPVHKKILEYYCKEDAACICVTCRLDGEHQGHQVETLDEASEKKKKKLRNVFQKLVAKREETEGRVQSLEERCRKAQEKASGEAERVTALFVDIRRRLDNVEKKLLNEISRERENTSLSLSALIQMFEIKKDELSRKMKHIEELCNMTDPLTVLQEPDTGDLCDPEEEGGDGDTGGCDIGYGKAKLISHISQTLSDLIKDVNVTFYVQDPAEILMDLNTAANNILISDDLKTVTRTEMSQNRPKTAERFQDYQDYRRGRQSHIGDNNKSWGLIRFSGQYYVVHDSKRAAQCDNILSNRFRICLDYEAGELSFYELCDPIRHLHTFTTTFRLPL
ncbi:hypothetical protein GDO81_021758 [Engystomops pustulosus]|uniref:Uncharacterized protein n=1 Tax=Engystomops pustulosus TaxID=76066 RepID=A0AAV6ZP55_ENGPU|nr:hypothetical protein GDO81_021758 [Engystomops pustulosus]